MHNLDSLFKLILITNAAINDFPINIGQSVLQLQHDEDSQLNLRINYPSGIYLMPLVDEVIERFTVKAAITNYEIEAKYCYVKAHDENAVEGGGELDTLCPHVEIRRLVETPHAGAIKVHAVLTNLVIFTPVASPPENVITFAGQSWTFTLKESFIELRKQNQALQSRLTLVLNTDADTLEHAVAIEESIMKGCELLSYACDTDVRLARFVVTDTNGKILQLKLKHNDLAHGPVLPPIPFDHTYSEGFLVFLPTVFDNYMQNRDCYLLPAVMNLCSKARRESFVSLQALMVSNALEILRFNYGHNVLVPLGCATSDKDDLYWPGLQTKQNKANFKALLEHLATSLNVTKWDNTFKDLRNKVVHTGEVPGETLIEKYNNTMNALHFVDVLVLSLLGWDGDGRRYHPCNAVMDPRPNVRGMNIIPFQR